MQYYLEGSRRAVMGKVQQLKSFHGMLAGECDTDATVYRRGVGLACPQHPLAGLPKLPVSSPARQTTTHHLRFRIERCVAPPANLKGPNRTHGP
jgi:hypothetical protein